MLDVDLGRFDLDSLPSALVFADTETGGNAAAAAVIRSNGRVAGQLTLRDAEDRLDRQAAADAVLIELAAEHTACSDALLDRVGRMASQQGQVAVVSASLATIDGVVARLGDTPVTLLCEPDEGERAWALALAWAAPAEARLADVSAEMDGHRLRRLAEEMSRVAKVLSSLSSQESGVKSLTGRFAPEVEAPAQSYDPEPPVPGKPALPDAGAVRALLRLRRLREAFFAAGLFADPAWDMLLDLFAAHIEGERVAVSSLCIAAAVPPTTALRWIGTMTENGLFERHADPLDGRRVFIRLSDTAIDGMAHYFAAMQRIEGSVA